MRVWARREGEGGKVAGGRVSGGARVRIGREGGKVSGRVSRGGRARVGRKAAGGLAEGGALHSGPCEVASVHRPAYVAHGQEAAVKEEQHAEDREEHAKAGQADADLCVCAFHAQVRKEEGGRVLKKAGVGEAGRKALGGREGPDKARKARSWRREREGEWAACTRCAARTLHVGEPFRVVGHSR